jgi:hypothetical protein
MMPRPSTSSGVMVIGSSRWPSRSTTYSVGCPARGAVASWRSSKVRISCPAAITMRSPGSMPTSAAGVPGSTMPTAKGSLTSPSGKPTRASTNTITEAAR